MLYDMGLQTNKNKIIFEILGQADIKYFILNTFPYSQYKLISWSCIIHSEHDKLRGGDKHYK